jgi:MerC mercury resistance protein
VSLDRIGTYAGLLCAVHCGLLGVAPALIAVAGLGTLWSPNAEWIAIAISSTFAFLGAVLGFRRHRRPWVPLLFLLSVLWMLGARWLEQHGHSGPWFAIACALGGLGTAIAHVINRACGVEHGHPGHSHAAHGHGSASVTAQAEPVSAGLPIAAADVIER